MPYRFLIYHFPYSPHHIFHFDASCYLSRHCDGLWIRFISGPFTLDPLRFEGSSLRRSSKSQYHRICSLCGQLHRIDQRPVGQQRRCIARVVRLSRDYGAAGHVQSAGCLLFGAEIARSVRLVCAKSDGRLRIAPSARIHSNQFQETGVLVIRSRFPRIRSARSHYDVIIAFMFTAPTLLHWCNAPI